MPEQIYVHLGGGVGACVIIADRTDRGNTGYAGEPGHITAPSGDYPCQCGGSGHLETLALAPAIIEIAGAADLEDLWCMLDVYAPDTTGALVETSWTMAQIRAAAVLLMSPSRIVLEGELATVRPELVPQIVVDIAGCLVPGTGWGVEVAVARLDGLGCAQGAVAAADSYVTTCLRGARRHQRSYA